MFPTIATTQLNGYNGGGTSAILRFKADCDFVTSAGEVVKAGKTYRDIACDVAGTVLTIPTITTIPSTTDSTSNSQATWTATIYVNARKKYDVWLGGFHLSHTLPTPTWGDVINHDNPPGPQPGVYGISYDQAALMISQQVGTLNDAAVGVKGRGSASVAPAQASMPIFVSDNDRRVQNAYNVKATAIGAIGDGTTNDRAALNTLVNTTLQITGAGGEVYLPAGDYSIQSNMTFPANVRLNFDPRARLKPATGVTITDLTDHSQWGTAQKYTNALAGQGAISYAAHGSLFEVYPLWWGGAGDATTSGVGTDNYPAWLAAMTAMGTLDTRTNKYVGVRIAYPAGRFYFSSTLLVTRQIVLTGVNASNDIGSTITNMGGGGTVFYFADGVNGINLSSATAGTNAAFSVVRNLTVASKGKTGATAHGIFCETRFQLENVYAWGFKGHGIYVNASTADTPPTNANNWKIINCSSTYNGGDGLHVSGTGANDVNAGYAMGLDCSNNTGWGIYDVSYLGNTYIAPHTMTNGLGPYHIVPTNANASALLLNPYDEGDQGVSELYPTVAVIGDGLYGGFSSGAGSLGSRLGVHFGVGTLTPAGVADFIGGPTGRVTIAGSVNLPTDNSPKLSLWGQGGAAPDFNVSGPSFQGINYAGGAGSFGRKRLAVFQHDANDYTTETEVASWQANGIFNTFKGADVASATAIVPTGNLFHVTGVTTITSITSTGLIAGTRLRLIFDSTAQISDGNNLVLAGNFTGGANRTLTLDFDGVSFFEASRSAN